MRTSVLLGSVSCTCMGIILIVVLVVCLVMIARKRNREKLSREQRDKETAIRRLAEMNKNAAQATGAQSRAPPPTQTAPYAPPAKAQAVPAKPTSAQRFEAGMKLFEFDNTGPVPALEEFQNVTFVGRTLEIVPDDGKYAERCHRNKYCSHVEVSGGKCILKNRQMAMFDGDAAMANFLGFEPLPECLGKKCMDGYKSGVKTFMHPDRMDFKPKGGESDKLKGYREAAKMHHNMKDAITCNALCKFAKAMNIVGIIFLFAGGPGVVTGMLRAATSAAATTATRASTAFLAADITAAGVELGAAIPNEKDQARNQQALQDTLQALVENPAFIYHNIRGGDLQRVQNGIECSQFCGFRPDREGLMMMHSLSELNKPENSAQKQKYIEFARSRQNTCCNNGMLSADQRRQCLDGTTNVGEFVVGNEHMCTAGSNLLDSISWHKLPQAPNNYSDVMYKFYKAKKLDFPV